jgi:hypothetical protein
MPKAALPDASNLASLLFSTGLWTKPVASAAQQQGAVDLDGAIAAAYAIWQREVRYTPFLAATQTRLYDPPGPEKGAPGYFISLPGTGLGRIGGSNILSVRSGLLSVTTLTVGITLTYAGKVLVANTDFWLTPSDAAFYNRPFTSVQFRTVQYGEPQSISILGSFGFSATVPDDAWTAINRLAASIILHEIGLFTTGLHKSEAQGDEKVEFLSFTTLAAAYEKQAMSVAARYRRPSIL